MDSIQHNLAGRRKRFLAYLIDFIPISILVFGVFYIFFGFDETLERYFNRGKESQPLLDFYIQRNWIRDISFLTWVVYCIIMEASENQGTFGKSAMGIKVIDQYGNRMSIIKSIGRNTCKILSFIVISLGFIWILFDKKRQGWHDKINKTYVVDKNFENKPMT
ncbi:MAG: RDD family protein [Saprospiraceae bacterium]